MCLRHCLSQGCVTSPQEQEEAQPAQAAQHEGPGRSTAKARGGPRGGAAKKDGEHNLSKVVSIRILVQR